jgi:hypothetical protein
MELWFSRRNDGFSVTSFVQRDVVSKGDAFFRKTFSEFSFVWPSSATSQFVCTSGRPPRTLGKVRRARPGNTKRESITILLTSCLTGLD